MKSLLSDTMLEQVAARFRTLGEPMRLRILQVLEGGEKTVSEVVAQTAASQPNVSQHLQELYRAGLVGRRKSGNRVHYWIADPVVFSLCELVCAGAEGKARLEHLVDQSAQRGQA